MTADLSDLAERANDLNRALESAMRMDLRLTYEASAAAVRAATAGMVIPAATVVVEPVLDLDALERIAHDAIVASPGIRLVPRRVAAAVYRYVAPIIATARQSTAPTDPAKLAKDPKVAAAVLRAFVTAEDRQRQIAWLVGGAEILECANELDPPEPVDPPMADNEAAGLRGCNAWRASSGLSPLSVHEWHADIGIRTRWLAVVDATRGAE